MPHADTDQIIAAWVAGQPAAEIAARHGITSRAVERVIAGHPLVEQPPRPPITVIVALVVVLFDSLSLLIALIFTGTSDLTGLVVVSVGLHGWLAWGLWKGWRRAGWLAIGGGAALAFASLGNSLLGPLSAGLLGDRGRGPARGVACAQEIPLLV